MVDLMTPEQPIRVGLLELDFSVVDVEILDQTLFMITEYPGRVLTVDVSQPEAPLVTGEPFGSVSVHGLAARGNRLYVTTGSSQEAHQVTVYDVRDPYSPFSVASIETNGERFAGIAADANSSYAVDYRTDVSGSDTRTGLRVFGWRSGFTFEQVGFLSLPRQRLRLLRRAKSRRWPRSRVPRFGGPAAHRRRSGRGQRQRSVQPRRRGVC